MTGFLPRVWQIFKGGIKLPGFLRMGLPHPIVGAGVWLMFCVVLVWFVSCNFFGKVQNQDECYMALCCRYYTDQPMAMLTFYVGWLWMQLFGDQVISLRLLATLCYFLATFFPVYYFYRRTRNLNWAVFIASVVLVVIECTQIKFYGWDAGVYVYESALLTLCMFYIDNPSKKKGILMGMVLALMVLARVPSGVLGIPAVLWCAVAGARRRGYNAAWIWGIVLRGMVTFVVTAVLVMCVMKGSPIAYLQSWVPDNIITGHGFRDMRYGYICWMLYDLYFFENTYSFWNDAILAIIFLLPFDSKSRNVLGLILLSLVCWRRVVLHQTSLLPWMCIIFGLLLYIIIRKIIARLRHGRVDDVKIDLIQFAMIFIFAFVPVVGSDRILVRVTVFYSIPFIMVWLYPWRNGIIKWFLLFMTLPAMCYGVYGRVRDLERCQRMDDVLPYHRYILEYPDNPGYITPLKPVVARLEKEGKKFGSFGEFRYGPVYLFEKEKPYRLNTFHNYYPEETEAVVRDLAHHLDALFIQPNNTPALSFDRIQEILYSEGFVHTTVAGSYWVFEKKAVE